MFRKIVLTLIVATLFFSGSFFSRPAMVHAEEFSADIVTDMHTGSVTGKMYFKTTRVNRNDMMGMINIMKHPQVYQLFTGTKKYHVSDVTELETDSPMAGISDFETWAKESNLQKPVPNPLKDLSVTSMKAQLKWMKRPEKPHP